MTGRQLFSQIRAKQQGHRCILEGPKQGLLIHGDDNQFIPFVEDGDKGYCLLPMHPPPSPVARHADLTASSMHVVNLSQHTEFAAPAHVSTGMNLKLAKSQRFLTERAAFRKRRGEALQRAKELKAKEQAKLRLMRQKLQQAKHRSDFVYMHRKCGHTYLKRLCKFKRTGKVIASRLPSKFLREYRDECPICLAMKSTFGQGSRCHLVKALFPKYIEELLDRLFPACPGILRHHLTPNTPPMALQQRLSLIHI